jgi:hypothetical protein
MSHHEHKEEKKRKKLAQLLHNRRHLNINQQADTLERSRDLEKEREEELRESALTNSRSAVQSKAAGKPDTFRKLDEIRQKNSHRARVSADRWNRFAGTESGGGRGL